MAEEAETVTLRLLNPGGLATLGSPSTAVLTITDNDPAPVIAFASAKVAVRETGPVASIVVKRTGVAGVPASANFTTSDGTAAAGSDYTLTSGTVAFAAGVVSQTITVPVSSDSVPEGAETFQVTLSPVAGAALGAVKSTTVTITDDDQGLAFSAAAYTVAETAPKATVVVKRTGGTTGTLVVNFATSPGTAVPGTDYTTTATTLTFGPGVASKTVIIPILDDAVSDGSRTVLLTLDPATGSPSSAVLTITDNEPVFAFSLAAFKVAESAASATITVKRTGPTTGTSSVNFQASGGTAVNGTDYTLAAGTLTFGAGVISRTFTVAITPDTLDEADETVLLSLTQNGGGLPIGAPGTATLTITDNDVAGKIGFTASDFSALEGSGTAEITLTRSGGTSSEASVVVTLGGGTAVAGTHYTNPGPVLVTFAANQTSASFPVARPERRPELGQPFRELVAGQFRRRSHGGNDHSRRALDRGRRRRVGVSASPPRTSRLAPAWWCWHQAGLRAVGEGDAGRDAASRGRGEVHVVAQDGARSGEGFVDRGDGTHGAFGGRLRPAHPEEGDVFGKASSDPIRGTHDAVERNQANGLGGQGPRDAAPPVPDRLVAAEGAEREHDGPPRGFQPPFVHAKRRQAGARIAADGDDGIGASRGAERLAQCRHRRKNGQRDQDPPCQASLQDAKADSFRNESPITRLFVAERDHRVDADGAARREQAGRRARHRHHRDHDAQRQHVVRRDTEELAGEDARRGQAGHDAEGQAQPHQARAHAEHHAQDVGALGAEGHADPDLVRLPRHRVGDHAVDADRHQHHAQRRRTRRGSPGRGAARRRRSAAGGR